MELIQVSHNEMAALFTRPSHIYNSVGFALLNAPKADSVEFLTFRDTRLRGGLILGMCGAMAGEPYAVPILLGLGLDEFSMSATQILKARKVVTSLSYAEMQKLADHCLNLDSAEEVLDYVKSVVD